MEALILGDAASSITAAAVGRPAGLGSAGARLKALPAPLSSAASRVQRSRRVARSALGAGVMPVAGVLSV
jgi:hypothetical protein